MKVIFTFSDSSTYESSIIRQGFSCQEILFNRLQASDGFVGFSIPFSTTFSNKMTADINNNVLAVVYDDNNNPYATGFVKKEVGYEQKYRNQPIKITIVSKSYMLDKTLNESYALESYTSAQIVTWLLTQAGISDIGSLSSMTTTVPLFVFNAGENIKDVLKEFCFEYSKTFYFDKNGYFQVADLFISSFTASQTFNRSNIRDRVNINVKEAEANCIRGRWTPLSLVSDTLVFEDKQNATSQYDCVIPIAANSWFGGVEDNFLKCDSTLGEVKYVKAITQNNIQSDTGITKTLDLLERTSLNQLHFTAKNTTASVKNITKMQVYANAYIAKENRVDVTTYGNKEKELSLKYIQDQTTAQNFVKALADYYNSTSFTVSFSSDEVCDIGDLVTVSADGIGSFNCRIIQRTRNIITSTIDYVCENIGDYTPAVIVQTVQEPLAVNIAGGQKGLDGAPGTPGADGKNAITMISSTTPSGEYNGQIGFWQGQPYMWNGSSWVKQIGDLPTDAVLHYSFDEVPDYPDASADERYLNGTTYDTPLGANGTVTTSGYVAGDNKIHKSNINGNANFKSDITTATSRGVYKSLTNYIGKVVVIEFLAKTANLDVKVEYRTQSDTSTSEARPWGTFAIGKHKLVFTVPSYVTYTICFYGRANRGDYTEWELLNWYIGDGSYSTPIIDNANGQWNSISQSGVAVQGVSGKGAKFFNKSYLNAGNFNFNDNFSVSVFIKVDNNTALKRQIILRKQSELVLINSGGNSGDDYLSIYYYNESGTASYHNLGALLTPNVFNHICLTKNGTELKYYLNGQLTSTKTVPQYINSNNNNLTIGGDTTGNARDQILDDLLIFDRALSETEVLALYQNKANTPKYYDLSDYIVEGIDDDGIISPSEKEILYQKWIDIYAVLNGTAITASSTGQGGEYGKMISRATTAGVSLVTTGGEGKAYVDATEALRAGLWTTAYLQNMSVQTKVSAGAIDTLFNNYRTAYEALSIAIDVQNKATASALSISQSNSYHQVPTNSSGTPKSYVGTDNTVYLLEGSSKLTCVATGTTLTAGKWKITNITMTGCTSGTTKDNYTIDSNGAVLGVLTGMTEQSAKRTLTIQFMGNNASTAETITVVQSFAKSQAGADGSTYKLLASANCVKTNTSVRFDAKKIVGESVSSYADGYLYSSTDGTTWTAKGQFKNGSAYASKNISVSVDTIFRLCLTESPSTNLVDELSVNIYKDGEAGHSPTVTATKSGSQTTIEVDGVVQATIDDGINAVTYEIECPSTYKKGDTVTFNFYKWENGTRTASSVYYVVKNGNTTITNGSGTGTTFTTGALNSETNLTCTIYTEQGGTQLDQEYSIRLGENYTCGVSNQNFSVATGTDLKPLSTPSIDVVFTAYRGNTALQAVANGITPSNNQFRVKTPTAPTGFTVSRLSPAYNTVRFKPTSTSTAISENAVVNITVEYEGTTVTETKTITISASEKGATGSTGVSMRNKGNWASGVAYVNDSSYIDTVFYTLNGCSYVCIQSHTSSSSILPTNTSYWSKIADKGATGQRGGQYLGAKTSDPTSEMVNGDYYFNNSSDSVIGGYLRTYNNGWSNDTMNTSNAHVFEAVQDIIAWVGDTTHSTLTVYTADKSIADSWCDDILAGTGFIGKLSTHEINFKEYVASYKDTSPVVGDLAISMGKNPKNSSDDEHNFIIQSYKTTVGNNEIWNKEFYTDNNDSRTDININGIVKPLYGVETYEKIFAGFNFVSTIIPKLNGEAFMEAYQSNGVVYHRAVVFIYFGGYHYAFISTYPQTGTRTYTFRIYRTSSSFNYTTYDVNQSAIGYIHDAVIYNGYVYISSSTGLYRYSIQNKSITTIESGVAIYSLQVMDNLIYYSKSGYIYSYDGTTATQKCYGRTLSKFTDEMYITSDRVPDEDGSTTLGTTTVYFYDNNFVSLGQKSLSGKPVTVNGETLTVSATSSVFANNGILYTLYFNSDLTKYGIIFSYDGGDTWINRILFSQGIFLNFRNWQNNNLMIMRGGSSYAYSTDGGKTLQIKNANDEYDSHDGTCVLVESDSSKDVYIPYIGNVSVYYGQIYFDKYTNISVTNNFITNEKSNVTDSNKLELAQGLMIQWGQVELGTVSAGSEKTATITFNSLSNGKNYYDNCYSIQLTQQGSTTGTELAVTSKSNTAFTITAYSRNSSSTISNCVIHWLTIGNAIK